MQNTFSLEDSQWPTLLVEELSSFYPPQMEFDEDADTNFTKDADTNFSSFSNQNDFSLSTPKGSEVRVSCSSVFVKSPIKPARA